MQNTRLLPKSPISIRKSKKRKPTYGNRDYSRAYTPTGGAGPASIRDIMSRLKENWGRTAAERKARPSDAQALIDEYTKAYGEAKEANEARYAEVLGGYRKRYNEALAELEGMGSQEKADITSRWNAESSKGQQDLTSRGLTGTTVLPTMKGMYEREKGSSLGRLDERLRREKIGLMTGLSGDTLGFMERREDVYPDLSMYANLASKYGQGSGAGGGVYGSFPNLNLSVGGSRTNLSRSRRRGLKYPPKPGNRMFWAGRGTPKKLTKSKDSGLPRAPDPYQWQYGQRPMAG